MTTSPTGSTPSTLAPDERGALRLRIDHAVPVGGLDGAWWPRSRDLARESVDLVDHFPADVGRISRLLYSGPDWDPTATGVPLRRVQVAAGTVKLGTFPSDDTHVMVLTLSTHERLRVLVVPAATDPDLAEQAMAAAADREDTRGARELLGL
ncbi:MAG: DUF5994 family protein [Actinomycetota bacterium]|nr:DUF5994 family protein [Actinomycetota bacterium]MEE3126815.1 DUF5994 family protein [Actinomycetota bacterium]